MLVYRLIWVTAIYCFILKQCSGVWTAFDLVRTKIGAWDSNGHVPYIKIHTIQDKDGIRLSNKGTLFGSAVANIGDVNGDGIYDIGV